MNKKLTVAVNKMAGAYQVRSAVIDGINYLVAPCVMIVNGVLNDALCTEEEFGRYVESWNGIPIPVLHPELNGAPISANSPDIYNANNIGQVFNAKAEDGKLTAELWINVAKAERLQQNELLRKLQAGEPIEVSTSYFCDIEEKPGVYNNVEYKEIQRNLRPDHLALLPGQIGACSLEDGCGVRANSLKKKFAGVVNALAAGLGLLVNKCKCEDKTMDLLKKAQALKANGKITQEQLDMVQSLDEEGRKMLLAIIGALADTAPKEPKPGEPAVADNADEPRPGDQAAAAPSAEDVSKMVANGVADGIKRHELTAKLINNEANVFDHADLAAMTTAQLEKLEAKLRPADYSGMGGGQASNHSQNDAVATEPMVIRAGILGKKKGAA